MENTNKTPGPKGRPFNGRHYPKIKSIRKEPRQQIRKLLRSFTPLNSKIADEAINLADH